MRLFFALELPAAVRAALGALRPPDTTPAARAYRWVDPALLHLTLAFLGEQPPDALGTLRAVGLAAASQCRRATLLTDDLPRGFGPREAPRVLWVGIAGDRPALDCVQRRLADALRRAGFSIDARPFAPHVTLARRRESPAPAPLGWRPAGRQPALPVPLDAISLMRSELGPAGPRYTTLERFPLLPAREGIDRPPGPRV